MARALLPPRLFEPAEIEHSFLSSHARQSGPQRRVGVILALFVWVAYSSVDYMNVGPGSGAEVLFQKILILRVLGTVAIVIGACLAWGPKFLEDTHSSRVLFAFVTIVYLLLLGMVAEIEFPFSYVVDYPGLILYFFFVIGLLKLKAKTFLSFISMAFPISMLELYIADSNSQEVNKNFSVEPIHDALPMFANYYYISTLIYLASSMLVGYAICCQLERDARAAFCRERQLANSNATLIEARRDVENKTLALIAAKEELRGAAERANLEKSKFLADAVHDLSQPTQAVSLLVESTRLALGREDYAMATNLIEMTGRAVQIARSSFQAVLEVSRLESGLVKPVLAPFTIQDVVTEALAPLRIIAEANSVKIHIRASADDRLAAYSDRTLLFRALANLASNAIKYSDPGKGDRKVLLIGVVALPSRVKIHVVDNGIGIPQKQRDEVFKPFVQLHNPEHNRDKGLGLGLSIVNAVFAVLPDHRFQMRSREGRGTRFWLDIPRDHGSLAPPSFPGILPTRSADLSALFVWLVEDDEIMRVATSALLAEFGILVEQAASFEAVEQQLPFIERRPDLLISDYRLPGGRTAADVIAMFAGRWDAEVPVVVLTGDGSLADAETLGPNILILKKPASPMEIIDAIHQQCVKSSTGPEALE